MYEDDENEELQEALGPVRQYFSGREVTVNTVLAAYLRSVGLPAYGEAWETAKRAVRDGYSFAQAVRVATRTPASPVAQVQTTSAFVGRRSLGWFPKQFGPGDIDGVGARRLLGTPNTDLASLLVRETAQNSWDARGVSSRIDFILNLRRLEKPLIETLRNRVFTEDPPRTGLRELLQRDEIWALEVSDRRTVGLGGPIRNDLALEPGIDRNFIDLVFNIGAPRDVHLGGGTYGFGKTITYIASSVSTILIWSRCEGVSGLEDRLIGSAMGDAFNEGGLRYTGRHWWGNVISTENRVEPIVGSLARELGEAAFAQHFDHEITGTSILILDPKLGGDSAEENVKRLADAVIWNLWPKLVASQSNQAQMDVSIQLDGQPVHLPDIQRHPVLSGYAQCLLAIRAKQSGMDPASVPQRVPVEMQEVWCMKPRILLGHLALTRYPAPPQAESPAHSVALMRQAELVVKYYERRELDVEGFQWAGVFKPVMNVDDSFAMAEPPAHDDWVPNTMEDPDRKREVNVGLKRIKEFTEAYLMPKSANPPQSDTLPGSAVHVADMLADLLSGLEGTGATQMQVALPGAKGLGITITPSHEDNQPNETPSPEPRATATRSSATAPPRSGVNHFGRPKVDVTGIHREPAVTPGWSRTAVQVQLSNTSPPGTVVDVAVRVGVEGGSMDDSEVVRIIGWRSGQREAFTPQPQAFEPGSAREFIYESRSDLAIDIETKLVAS